MNELPESVHPNCQMQEQLSGFLDGQLSIEDQRCIELHLERCASCREFCAVTKSIGRQLRRMQFEPFPSAALNQLFAATVETRDAGKRTTHKHWYRTALPRAAVLLLAVSLSWFSWDRYERANEAELNRSVQQVRYVLGTTARALQRAERTGVSEILIRRVAAPLNRISSQWLEQLPSTKRRIGT